MKLSIRHATRYTYDPEAGKVGLRLKLFPATLDSQSVSEWTVAVNDDPVGILHTDGAGDAVGLWFSPAPIGTVEVSANGVIETTDTAGVLRAGSEVTRPAVYLRETEATKPNDAIRLLADEIEGADPLGQMHALSALVHKVIDYRPGVTESGTTAVEAIALGSGVCQDQTHVFLSAARAMDVPARYVVGYLDDPDSEVPPDQTHAWAEVHVKGLGWVGFDVTNQLCPTDAYVRLCSGLDAADAAPIRGTVSGETEEEMEVDIAVERATASQSQSQQ
ncbi:MAG: transglutaminase family protein [Pseudomonadota bacterium]